MKDKDINTFTESFEDGSDLDITLNYPEQISDRVNLDVISDKVHVRIKKMAKDLIDEYAASNIKKELGGVLIGNYKQINDHYYVYIEAILKANYTDASKSEIKFTHQTWEDIDRKKDQYYPNKKIVGWFHTHPGFGVFLSDYDLFIQENFFKLAFQVAYVVDPVKDQAVFFGNDDGEIVKINYEIEETAMPVYTPRPVVTGYSKKRSFKKKFNRAFIFVSILVYSLVLLLIGFLLGMNFKSGEKDAKDSLNVESKDLIALNNGFYSDCLIEAKTEEEQPA
jgi:proteasome lid subunit RPN8/RPN11